MTDPKTLDTTTARLGEQEIEILHSLLGRHVLELYAPSIDVSDLWCGAPSFSIYLGDRYIFVDSEWKETPVEILDYFVLRVGISDHPKDIPETRKDGKRIFGAPVSTVSLRAPGSPVVSVAILEHSEVGERESVLYDAGLVVTLEDDRSFALATRQSVLGGVECSTHPPAIKNFFKRFSLRTIVK